jgi:hypothetical protein
MHYIGTFTQKTDDGYIRTLDKYQAKNCANCPLNGICHKSKGNRIIEVSHRGNELKKQALDNLISETGIYYRKKRCIDPEPVFGNIKHNKNFKRYILRGLQKVYVKTGLSQLKEKISLE